MRILDAWVAGRMGETYECRTVGEMRFWLRGFAAACKAARS